MSQRNSIDSTEETLSFKYDVFSSYNMDEWMKGVNYKYSYI